MCGLTGLLLPLGRKAEGVAGLRERLAMMTDCLIPRGPDAGGMIFDGPVALGHRRLSILDLAVTGAQPMRLGVDGPVIVYNGECYNFAVLREELMARGRQFRGSSDTEVVLSAYAEWGLPGLKRLEGIFALALWDPSAKRLVLMRDRLGVKPLFFAQSEHGLAFGSEIKSVLAAGGIDRDLDDQSFSEYLWYGNTHGDRSFYLGIRSLEPGHWLISEGGNHRVEPWWKIEEWMQHPRQAVCMVEAAEQVRIALDQAVARQMVADVPVGLFLSGGIDSTAIAASAMQGGAVPLRSYTAGFDFEYGVNELDKSAKVALQLGLNHKEMHISGHELPEILEILASAHDEPFADAANIPLFLMSREIAGEVKVVLQGDGGDEMFAGYRRYAMLRNAHWWRLWPRQLSALVQLAGSSGSRFVRMAESAGHADPAMRMAHLLTVETDHHPPEALLRVERRQQLAETTDPFLAYRQAEVRFKDYDPVQQMLLTDLTVQLPSQFLTKVDRATMAAGIEARVPFLDERIGELAVGMPSRWKARGTQKKIVLRASQRSRVSSSVLDGPKTGFGVPYEHWLRTSLFDYARDRVLDRRFLDHFEIDGKRAESMFKCHRSGAGDRGFMLWKLLQLALHHSVAHAT